MGKTEGVVKEEKGEKERGGRRRKKEIEKKK